jgi:hypothetical protein
MYRLFPGQFDERPDKPNISDLDMHRSAHLAEWT